MTRPARLVASLRRVSSKFGTPAFLPAPPHVTPHDRPMLSALSLGGFTMGSAGAGPAAMDVSLDDMIKQVRGQAPPLGNSRDAFGEFGVSASDRVPLRSPRIANAGL